MTAPQGLFKMAGGKRMLAPAILNLVPTSGWTSYAEPMVGGGAVFFALHAAGRLEHKRVVLADMNAEAMALYGAVRDRPLEVVNGYADLAVDHERAEDTRAYYERQRVLWNAGERTPGRQLYLRYACYNGLWRVNASGGFNTPWNQKRVLPVLGDLLFGASTALADVELLTQDVQSFHFGPGCFVYLDPAYDNETANGGFTAYTPGGFTEADQVALIKTAARWHKAGATVLYSNAATQRIRASLKAHWPKAAIYHVENRRLIAANAALRGDVKELLVLGAA